MSASVSCVNEAGSFAGCARVDQRCFACVIIPARNEEHTLSATLDALRLQVDENGVALDPSSFEVLLLLNNCTDRSAAVAREYGVRHPALRLHVMETVLAAPDAHVGTARRMLMDLACERMEVAEAGAILSTDADTLVAPDWIVRNLGHLHAGAEVVGGVIHLLPDDLADLEPGTRAAYDLDREFQELVARLESLLDPDPADPWPRHLEHFGASLACNCQVYRRAGGMPSVTPLEDVAFVDALRKVNARIRHATDVHIYTSARLDGRADVGLSGQLRHWQRDFKQGRPQMVESAEWIEHRFRTLGLLRRLHAMEELGCCDEVPVAWRERLSAVHGQQLGYGRYLEMLDCNKLIDETFSGPRHDEIKTVNAALKQRISFLDAPEHPV